MKIARQGWKFVAFGFGAMGLGLFLIAGLQLFIPGILLTMLGAGFAAFCAYFFRDPERPLPGDASKIYSPGDGTVLSVAREGPADIVTLRIFLSIFNVHLQRAPCSGRVKQVHHQDGSFKAAMSAEAKANERSVMTIMPEGRKDPLIVEQIAGLIARRIECWPKVDERLTAGQRYGIIYFGSQAAVHFPVSARCLVAPGDKVVGGVTVIGEWIS